MKTILRPILFVVLFAAVCVPTSVADSFAFVFVPSLTWPAGNLSWEASGSFDTVSSNGQNICGGYSSCQILTDISGQVNGQPITFDPLYVSEIVRDGDAPAGWGTNPIEFYVNGTVWGLFDEESYYGTPVPYLLAPVGGTGSWGYVAIVPVAEPSVAILLIVASLLSLCFALGSQKLRPNRSRSWRNLSHVAPNLQ